MLNQSGKRILSAAWPFSPSGSVRPSWGCVRPFPPQKPDVESFQIQDSRASGRQENAARVQRELSIGVKEGDEKYMFGRTSSSTPTTRQFYVTDWTEAILKYDPRASTSGPSAAKARAGEFQNLSVVRFDRTGRCMSRPFLQADLLFDKDGTYLRQIPTPDVSRTSTSAPRGYVSSRTIRRRRRPDGLQDHRRFFNDKFELATELNVRLSFYKPPPADATSRAKFTAGILSDAAFGEPMHLVARTA